MARLWIVPVCATLALVAAAADSTYEYSSGAGVTRASDLKGRVVETRDGEELGRVHDFAVDLSGGRISYIVVSVGSFLIDDSLIAVAPDALRESADTDGRLVLEADSASLRAAQRFSAGDWPRRADVVASPVRGEPAAGSVAGEAQESPPAARGTATISSSRRTATLSAGERSIRFLDPPQQETAGRDATAGPAPTTRFGRLDRNRDGKLDRAEIAHEMRRGDRFADIDLDASGGIDEGEFDAMQARREPGGD